MVVVCRKWVIKLARYKRNTKDTAEGWEAASSGDTSFIALSWDFLLFDSKIELNNNRSLFLFLAILFG